MLKLATTRTFSTPVTAHYIDESGKSQSGQFGAVFKVIPSDQLQSDENRDERLLDLVLVSVSDIELVDENGQALQGEALLEACKNDPTVSSSLIDAYGTKLAKKNRRA